MEAQQIRLNRIFKPKSTGTLTVVAEHGSAKLDYVVEKLSIPPNDFPLKAALSLVCPDPFFYAPKERSVVIAGIKSRFRLPFHFPSGAFNISEATKSVFCNVRNPGEADTGVTITFYAASAVTNPMLIDVATGKIAKINVEMQAGDTVIITTETGRKTIKLISGGVTTDIFNRRAYPFTFFQLPAGTTKYKYDADSGASSLRVAMTFREKFTSLYTEGST